MCIHRTVNRTDVLLMVALSNANADCVAFGRTITEIMEYIEDNGANKSRMTVYRRLRGLVEQGYVSKGVLENHADTFFILDAGKEFLKSTNRKGIKK